MCLLPLLFLLQYDPCWPGRPSSLSVPGQGLPVPNTAAHESLDPFGPACSDDVFFEQRGWHNLLTGPESWGLNMLPTMAHLCTQYGYRGMPDLSRWAEGLNATDCPRFGLPANCTTGGARLDLPLQPGPSGALMPEANDTLTRLMQVFEPYFKNQTFVGLFIGDELISSGAWSCQTMAGITGLIKMINPNVLVYTNEGGHWPCGGPGDKVMSTIDIFSWDAYGNRYCGAAEVVTVRNQAHEFYPRMYPHQKIMLVPGLFATDPVHCLKFHNESCPLDEQEAFIALKLKACVLRLWFFLIRAQLGHRTVSVLPACILLWRNNSHWMRRCCYSYWDWALSDLRVIGFKPYHLASFAEGASPASEQTIGAYAMPNVLPLLVHMGRAIVSK